MLRRDTKQIVEHTKGGREDRIVLLTAEAKDIIQKCLERQQEFGVPDNGYIFSIDGQPCSYYAISDLYRKYCEKLGIARKTSHKSRKTVISTLLDGGMSPQSVASMVGHADERTTLGNYYFDRSTEEDRIRIMEKAFNS